MATALIVSAMITFCLIVGYIIYWRCEYENKYKYNTYEKIRFEDYKPKVGDIIYVNYAIGRTINQFIIDGFFEHYVMVVKKDGRYFMLDICPHHVYFRNSPDTLTLIPIEFIKTSNNNYFVAPIAEELPDEVNEKLLNLKYKYWPFVTGFFKWLFGDKTNPANVYQHCLDLLAIELDIAGIMDIKDLSSPEKARILDNNFGQIYALV